MRWNSRWGLWAACAFQFACAPKLRAQWQANSGPSGAALGAIVGGDVERYLRALSLAGIVRPIAWGARPFGPDDVAALLADSTRAEHPWRRAISIATHKRQALAGMLFASGNSAFPWGSNDGPMWQGRGVTTAAGGAAAVRYGPLSLLAAPVAFSALNSPFRLMPQPAFGYSRYADPLFPTVIDLPQRMGGGTFARLDPGESSIRVRAGGAQLMLSTASLGWGIGEAFPAILGANAGGFPHVAAGTRRDGVRLPGLGRISAQYVLGVLQQSAWSPVQGSATFVDRAQTGTRRIGTGVVMSFMPAILPTLELGASRFYHSPFRNGANRWDAWSKPLEGLFKKGFTDRDGGPADPTGDVDNQMASFFARLIIPSRGAEASFELFREDHNWDARDLALEPENNSAVIASIRAVTSRRADKLGILTLEYFDGDIRPIAQVRAQGFLYTHAGLLQGHTQRGQLLGTPIGAGAMAGERIAWEEFTAAGSRRVALQRWRTRGFRTLNNEGLYPAASSAREGNHDWILDGSVAVSRYAGLRTATVEAGIAWAGVWQLNDSATNLYTRISWSIF